MEAAESSSPTQEGQKHQWMVSLPSAAMGIGGVGELWDLSLCLSLKEEFSHPVESLALTVDEVINVRRVLVKAEMEKFLPNKDLYNSLRKGKVLSVTSLPVKSLSVSCFVM